MGKTIEDKLKNVLSFIVSYTEENGFPPSVREIGANLSIKSTATTYYYLEKLKEQGYLKKTKSKNRAIEVINKNKISYKSVPLIGKVTAGIPITAVENIEEFIPLPSSMFKSNDLFMLSVCGESMIDAGIYDGDVIIVNRQDFADNGDIVVALIGDEATVKRFYKQKDCFVLHPENKKMKDIVVKELSILGVVNGLLRKY
ncbi:MAG: transcriptional repressor LexA [Clostridia bacterium]|nr:transcriptional repressor LexA [Clostridia bacterium]